MSSSFPSSLLDVELEAGRPPMLRVAEIWDAQGWAGEHRDALRASVTEHGSVLVRGLGLRDPAEVGAVFHRLATELMTEREAFADVERTAPRVPQLELAEASPPEQVQPGSRSATEPGAAAAGRAAEPVRQLDLDAAPDASATVHSLQLARERHLT